MNKGLINRAMALLLIAVIGIFPIVTCKDAMSSDEDPSYSRERTWTAPEDSIGWCAEYDMRYAADTMQLIGDWDNCIRVEGLPAPGQPGTKESFHVTGLAAGVWWFAIKTRDQAGNWSEISNFAQVIIDENGPVKIADLD